MDSTRPWTGPRTVVPLVLLALMAVAATALVACGDRLATEPQAPEEAAAAIVAASPAHDDAQAPQLTGGGLPPGCRCHSKIEWQVAMHELFGPADCDKCHGAGEDLMAGRGQMTEAHLAELEERQGREPVCLECHQQGATAVPARLSEMQGDLFCPTDGTMYGRDKAVAEGRGFVCPDDGTELVDVDAVTAASEKRPSNTYCVACHPPSDELDGQHAGVAGAAGVTDLSDCLSCHASHSQCGSCHH